MRTIIILILFLSACSCDQVKINDYSDKLILVNKHYETFFNIDINSGKAIKIKFPDINGVFIQSSYFLNKNEFLDQQDKSSVIYNINPFNLSKKKILSISDQTLLDFSYLNNKIIAITNDANIYPRNKITLSFYNVNSQKIEKTLPITSKVFGDNFAYRGAFFSDKQNYVAIVFMKQIIEGNVITADIQGENVIIIVDIENNKIIEEALSEPEISNILFELDNSTIILSSTSNGKVIQSDIDFKT